MVLICVSVMTSNVKHLHVSVGHVYVLFGSVYSGLLPIFKLGCLVFGLELCKFFINFGY